MAPTNKLLLKVILLGDAYVGKTSLIKQYIQKEFSEKYKTTIGVDFFTKNLIVNDRPVALQIWDTQGLDRYRSLGTAFYRGADSCVIVYDVTSEKTFQNLDYWRNEFLILGSPRDEQKFPFVVIGNKVDLDYRMVSTRKAQRWCDGKNGIPYFECSAKDNFNVNEVFQSIAEKALENEAFFEVYYGVDGINLKEDANSPNTWLDSCSC